MHFQSSGVTCGERLLATFRCARPEAASGRDLFLLRRNFAPYNQASCTLGAPAVRCVSAARFQLSLKTSHLAKLIQSRVLSTLDAVLGLTSGKRLPVCDQFGQEVYVNAVCHLTAHVSLSYRGYYV